MDLVVLLLIWLTAFVVGGVVGFRVAELSTLACVVARLLDLVPRGRPDEAYLVSLRRALTHRGGLRRVSRVRVTRSPLALRGGLLAGAVMVIVVQGAFPRAPSTSDLPLATTASVIASASGGSQIDTASDHSRYRYLVLAGPRSSSGSALMQNEIRQLTSQGWACTTEKLAHLRPRGETYHTLPRRCPTPMPSTNARLISSSDGLQIDLTVVNSQTDADQYPDATSLEANPGLHRALINREPVVWAVLAHGT